MAEDTESQAPAVEQPGADGAQAPAKALSIRQRLAQLVAGEEAAEELVGVKAQLTAVTGERDQLLTSVKGLNEKVTALHGEVTKLKADLTDAEQAVADFEKNVQAAAAEKAKKLTIDAVAAAGIPAAELPAITQSTTNAPRTREQLEAAMADEPDFGKRAEMLKAFQKANTSNN